jgi:NADH-quinone oxidoreductase subunit F
MAEYKPVLLANVGVEGIRQLDVYKSRGGYEQARKVVTAMGADDVVELVKKSNLRGRGGAGFPTGMKWSFLPEEREETIFCINFDEAEPGTFNNRYVSENDPHQLLESILIAGYATQSTKAYIYMRVEFHEPFHILQKALDEAYEAGMFGDNIFDSGYSLECYIHRGAGAYICGEETGLIESLEGKRGWPRIKPPFPTITGAFGKPTVVNNVETLLCLPHIVKNGADWFASMGTENGAGPKLYTVSGPVNRPGCYEAPMGLTVREVIYGEDFARGMRNDKKIKGVIPGGLSVGILTADELECKLDFSDPSNYGLLGLGTAGLMVINEDTDIRDVLFNTARFFSHESCGQCTQCREGTAWIQRIAERLLAGAGRSADLDLIIELTHSMGMMPGKSICGLPDGAAYPLRTIVEKFRDEFEEHIRRQEPGAVNRYLKQQNAALYEAALEPQRTLGLR